MADITIRIPPAAPVRYRHHTHATIADDGQVAVGVMSRIGLIGHIINALALSRDEAGLLAALMEEDRLLSLPLTEAQMAALGREPWCGVRCD